MAKRPSPSARGAQKARRPGTKRRGARSSARRLALAALHGADIRDHQIQFGESYDEALDRVVFEHDEVDRLFADLLKLAA